MSRFQLKNEKYNLPQESRYPRYIKKGTAEEKDTFPVGENNNEPPATHGSYGPLILHPNWKVKRKEILARDQFRCVICSSGKDLHVHHRQYHFIKATKKFKAPWDYPGHLLITLCSSCHSRGHSKYKVPSINI